MATPAHHVLVVGVGSIGERHLRCFLDSGRSRVSFVELREPLRNDIARRYPAATAYADLESALAANPTIALIATPAPLHVSLAAAMVERGLHVLIEKPLAVMPDGIDALIHAAEQCGVVAAVAYVYRAHPVLAQMRSALTSGEFGRPVELVAVCGQNFPLYRPAYRQTYYVKHETGGGAVQDALTHIINAGEWLLGPIRRVVADTAHQVVEGTDVEDTVHVLARHGEVPSSYSLNQHQAPNESTITVICDRGAVRFEAHANRWRSIKTLGGEWQDHPHAALERDTLFQRQANHFLDAIETFGTPVCTLAEGLQTLKVNRAILESARNGAWVTIS